MMPIIVIRKRGRARSGDAYHDKVMTVQGAFAAAEKAGKVKSDPPKNNKFGAKVTYVGGIRFSSRKEAKRYVELMALQDAGLVRFLERQPVFPIVLPPDGKPVVNRANRRYEYRADFKYQYRRSLKSTHWYDRVEDVKGYDTPISALKRALVKAIYQIHVVLT